MKTLFFLLMVTTFTSQGQMVGGVRVPGSYTSFTPGPGFNIAGGTGSKAPQPKDNIRVVGGVTWNLTGKQFTNGWVMFQGEIVEVQKNGVRIRGFFTGYPDEGTGADFFVENFPYEMAEGEHVGWDDKSKTFFYAKTAGVYTYKTVMGGSRTIRKLDYGEIYRPVSPEPLTAEQMAERKTAEEKRKATSAQSTIKWLQEQAAAGDAYCQFRLGERFLKGDGVDKDETKARALLEKASAQGNSDARELLLTLTAQK